MLNLKRKRRGLRKAEGICQLIRLNQPKYVLSPEIKVGYWRKVQVVLWKSWKIDGLARRQNKKWQFKTVVPRSATWVPSGLQSIYQRFCPEPKKEGNLKDGSDFCLGPAQPNLLPQVHWWCPWHCADSKNRERGLLRRVFLEPHEQGQSG